MVMRSVLAYHRCRFSSAAFVTLPAILFGLQVFPQPASAQGLNDDEVVEIGVEAYIYAFPLVMMDVTREVSRNCEKADLTALRAPMNQFVHLKSFPDATFTDVVRPNADTLYSSLWFDVSEEPLVIHVPDSGARYYLLPMLDMWTDVFASPGARTTGTAEQTFAIVGPRWKGKLPNGVQPVRSPTGIGWMIGRTQTDGQADFANVHKFQAGLTAVPLSAWGKDHALPRGKVDPTISSAPPVEQVAKMDVVTFFARFTELAREDPPRTTTQSSPA